jgi:hypothetical protein
MFSRMALCPSHRTSSAGGYHNTTHQDHAAAEVKVEDTLRIDFVGFYWSLVQIARHVASVEESRRMSASAQHARAVVHVPSRSGSGTRTGSGGPHVGSGCQHQSISRETRDEKGLADTNKEGIGCHDPHLRDEEVNVLSRIWLCHVIPFLSVERAATEPFVNQQLVGIHEPRVDRHGTTEADRQDNELLARSTISYLLRKMQLDDSECLRRLVWDGCVFDPGSVRTREIFPEEEEPRTRFPLYEIFLKYAQPNRAESNHVADIAPNQGFHPLYQVSISAFCTMFQDFAVTPSFISSEDVLLQVQYTRDSYNRGSLEDWLHTTVKIGPCPFQVLLPYPYPCLALPYS